MRTRPTAAERADLRRTPSDAITLRAIGARRRAAFGRGSMVTGPRQPDPVTGRRPRILPRPMLPVRTHGVDLAL